MKKNYLKPVLNVQAIALQNMMIVESTPIGGDIGEDEDVLVKEDFDNFFE